MRRITLSLLVVMVPLINLSLAQNRANIWMIGYNYSYTGPDIGLSFISGSFDTFSVFRDMQFFLTDASICDTSGQLLFYTNGIFMANRNHDSLLNCEQFNPGDETDYYGDFGLGQAQGAIILPMPDSGEKFYCFHTSSDYILTNNGTDAQPLELRYSIIDMTLDNGLGGLDPNYKKVPIIKDTLTRGMITACKHANGRDWWLVCHGYHDSTFYKLLITPTEILGPYEQEIGTRLSTYDLYGSARFSPDGTKYVWMEHRDTINFFDFDRCTGEFSNPVVAIAPADSYLTIGSSISASSRYLYVGSYYDVFQYDLLAADIAGSVTKVAHYDTTQVGLWFSQMQLAPDGKIYIATYNGSQYLHVINEPDSLALNCNVVQSQITMPSWNISSMPNFPNYDLGPLPGSPCDTLYSATSGETRQTSTYRLQPNPVLDWLNIIYQSEQDALFTLHDMHGRVAATVSLYHYFKNRLLDVSHLPQGIYFAEVTQGGEMVWSEKVVVLK